MSTFPDVVSPGYRPWEPQQRCSLRFLVRVGLGVDDTDMIIPYTQLSGEVLKGIIEEFVLREGTEYGDTDISLETKVTQVRRQLERGEAAVVFDAESETCSILPKSHPLARTPGS